MVERPKNGRRGQRFHSASQRLTSPGIQQPPVQRAPGGGGLLPGQVRYGRGMELTTHPSTADINNECRYTHTPFKWRHYMDRDNLTIFRHVRKIAKKQLLVYYLGQHMHNIYINNELFFIVKCSYMFRCICIIFRESYFLFANVRKSVRL